jgi:hypothetical protein
MRITKDHLPWDYPAKHLVGGFLWICPECGTVNAWNYEDAQRASKKLKVKVSISHGSAFDNNCGHCGVDIVHPDSPILAACYTHSED